MSATSDKSINIVVALAGILAIMWILGYVLPGIFSSLFNNWVGLSLMTILTVLVFLHNKVAGVGIAVVLFLIYRFVHLSHW